MKNKVLEQILKNEEIRNRVLIGEFDIVLSEELIAKNVKLGNNGSIKIYIYPEMTFPKPHIHISASRNIFPDGDAIVCLDRNYQWPHDGHLTILNKKQSEDLDKFMRQPYRYNKSITNWNFAVIYWNENHENLQIKITEQPDYTKLYCNIDSSGKK